MPTLCYLKSCSSAGICEVQRHDFNYTSHIAMKCNIHSLCFAWFAQELINMKVSIICQIYITILSMQTVYRRGRHARKTLEIAKSGLICIEYWLAKRRVALLKINGYNSGLHFWLSDWKQSLDTNAKKGLLSGCYNYLQNLQISGFQCSFPCQQCNTTIAFPYQNFPSLHRCITM